MSVESNPAYLLYFASTHWDREWYLPFQSFRCRLVDTVKEVLHVLENDPEFTAFILDGQTVTLEDYLEIVPEDSARLRALIDAGRLLVGPWYTMPDENLVSGESLIRNLLMGHNVAACVSQTGKVMPLGYLCDIFGHIAQMPQILNGFHIRNALLGRGTNDYDCPAYFLWEAPDGSQCVTFKVPESCGYGSFWMDVYAAGAAENAGKDELMEKAKTYVMQETKRSPVPCVILMDGMDHERIHKDAPWLTKKLSEAFHCPAEIGNIEGLRHILNGYRSQMPVKKGELQKTAKTMAEHNKLIPGTLSSRYDLKKSNDTVQSLLEKTAAPMAALVRLYGNNLPLSYFDVAYRYLLKNHAHDSICGCSIDEVHQDMAYRFRQADKIAHEICDSAFYSLCGMQEDKREGDIQKLVLFNPLPYKVKREVCVPVWFPLDYSRRFDEMIPSEPVNQFHILDEKHQEIAYQIKSILKNTYMRRPLGLYAQSKDCYTLWFTADLPAMNYSEYAVVPSEKPVRYFESLKTGDLTAENDLLRLTVTPVGRVYVTDKQTGYEYSDLLQYKDNGETGDGWTARPPVPDCIVHSGAAISVATVQDGVAACTFCITHSLSVPAQIEYHRQYTARSEQTAALIIKTYITLTKSSPYLQVSTVVTNTVYDHRLTLSLRTGIDTDTYTVEQAFAFVERPVGRELETHDWKESDRAEKSFGHIACRRRADGSGLAFVSKGGLHECAAQPGSEGRLDITLLRSFQKTFLTDGQPDGQLQGRLIFDYQILPFGPSMIFADLMREKEQLQTPPLCTTSPEDTSWTPKESRDSFRFDSAACIVSTIKPSEGDRIVVRVVNYSGETAGGILFCPRVLHSVHETDLLEQPLQMLPIEGNHVALSLAPYQIKTIALTFQPENSLEEIN